jgi:hypothetical protein
VHALHLAHRGSYEGTVIARLERRRARAAAAQPSSHASWTHADASMRRRLRELAHDLRPSARAAICLSRRTRPAASVIMIYVTSVLAGSGQLVERHITALRVEVGSTRRLTRHVVRSLMRNTNIRAVVIGDVQQHVSSARATIAPVSEHLVARLSALIATLDRKSPGGLWQASLFDPRVEHDVERHRAARASLKTHFERQSDIASQLQQLHADEPQLVAAWLSGW